MNEPSRLLDESDSEFERSLLRAGASYKVAPGVRARTLSALGIAGATALTAGVAGSATLSTAPPAIASTSLLAKLGWVKMTLAAATVSVIAAVPVVYLIAKSEPPVQVAPRPAAVIAAPKSAPPAAPVEPALPPEESQGAAVAAPEEQSPVAKPEKASAKPVLTSEALRAELSALDAARAALAAGNPQGALSLLDGYDRGNPKGLLKLEAEVLRIDALAKSGRADAARRRAQAFLARHPNSVLASRVRGYTAE